MNSGDTVYFRAGTYNEDIVVTKSGITLSGYPGETAIIDLAGAEGTNVYYGIDVHASSVTVENFTIKNVYDTGVIFCGVYQPGGNNYCGNYNCDPNSIGGRRCNYLDASHGIARNNILMNIGANGVEFVDQRANDGLAENNLSLNSSQAVAVFGADRITIRNNTYVNLTGGGNKAIALI